MFTARNKTQWIKLVREAKKHSKEGMMFLIGRFYEKEMGFFKGFTENVGYGINVSNDPYYLVIDGKFYCFETLSMRIYEIEPSPLTLYTVTEMIKYGAHSSMGSNAYMFLLPINEFLKDFIRESFKDEIEKADRGEENKRAWCKRYGFKRSEF